MAIISPYKIIHRGTKYVENKTYDVQFLKSAIRTTLRGDIIRYREIPKVRTNLLYILNIWGVPDVPVRQS